MRSLSVQSQSSATSRPLVDWGYEATHPSYDRLRGQEGSPRSIATNGKTDAQIIAADKIARPRMGSWLAQMAAERGAREAAE